MAERIVSPGVFTRERDLSFLPQAISEIGAAIIGPTEKGPSFVPTIVRSFEEFEKTFGSYNSAYYTPYTVKEYLSSAGTVTIVKVGYLGGYKVTGFNLIVSGSPSHLGADGKMVVATFLPAVNNSNGSGDISGSVAYPASASNFTLNIDGTNASASVSSITLVEDGSAVGLENAASNYILKVMPTDPNAQSIGSTEAPAYMYKFFRSSVSASFASGILSATSKVFTERSSDNYDFSTGAETVSTTDGNYISSITGNSSVSSGRTPYVHSQKIGGTTTNLFRIYTRADGTQTNGHYIVVRDIKRPQGSNSSPDFADFGMALYDTSGNLLENWSNLNMDPDSPNYLVKVIGDMFQTVNNDGEITSYGDYPNLSRYIRIGDHKEKTFRANKELQPMGFAAVYDVVVSSNVVPTASFAYTQTYDGGTGESSVY